VSRSLISCAVVVAAAAVADGAPLSREDFAEAITTTRALDAPARASDVLAPLAARGTLPAGWAYYLYWIAEGKLPTSDARTELVHGLQQHWAPLPGATARETIYFAYMHLRAAASDRALTAQEVSAARASLAAHPSVSATAAATAVTLVSRFSTFRAALAAGRQSRPAQDVALIGQIVTERYGPGARYVDTNSNGRVDASDHVATGSGPDRRLGTYRAREILLQKGIVHGVRRLLDAQGQVRMEFRLSAGTHFDRRFFRPDGRSFLPARGVQATQALDALYARPEGYGFECATAISIVHYYAIREALREDTGDDALFNRRFADMRIGQLGMGADDDLRAARRTLYGDMRIGDHGYFSNPDVSPTARAGGWNGENVISLGGDRYFGHPFGVTDSAEIIRHLNGVRRTGLASPRPARLQSNFIRLDPAVVFDRAN
jgi:protein-glutamine gamma-glutamyltransferase